MLPITFTQKITVPTHILYKDLNGEGVILNLESEAYFGLDEVASRMFSVLSTSDSIEAAFNILYSEYDVAANVLRQDLENFVQKLIAHGMVRVND